MSSIKLKPCRYCGHTPGEFAVKDGTTTPDGKRNGTYRYWVSCPNPACWADGPLGQSPEEAVRKWNRGVL